MPLGYFGGFLKEWLSPVSQCRHLGQSPPPPLPVGCPLTQSFLLFQPVRSVPKTLPRGLLHEKGNYWSGDTGGFWAEEHMLSLPLTGSHCCCVKNKLQGARAAARRRPVKSLLMCSWKIDGVCTGGGVAAAGWLAVRLWIYCPSEKREKEESRITPWFLAEN